MATLEKRIKDFATLSSVDDDDLFLVDTGNDTYNIKASTVLQYANETASETAKEIATEVATEVGESVGQSAAEKVIAQISNVVLSINEDDGGLDLIIYDDD